MPRLLSGRRVEAAAAEEQLVTLTSMPAQVESSLSFGSTQDGKNWGGGRGSGEAKTVEREAKT